VVVALVVAVAFNKANHKGPVSIWTQALFFQLLSITIPG